MKYNKAYYFSYPYSLLKLPPKGNTALRDRRPLGHDLHSAGTPSRHGSQHSSAPALSLGVFPAKLRRAGASVPSPTTCYQRVCDVYSRGVQLTPRYPCRRVYFNLSEPGPSHRETAPLRSDLPSDLPGQTPGKAPRPKSLSESSLLSLEPKEESRYMR